MKKGFTIIELLVVVCIIGILTSVILVATSSARKKSRDDKRKADLQSVALGLEMYYAKNKSYPIIIDFTNSWATLTNELRSFVPSWPTDPSNAASAYGSGYAYWSNTTTTGIRYVLEATLEINENKPGPPVGCTDLQTNLDDQCFFSDSYNVGDTTHYRISSQ